MLSLLFCFLWKFDKKLQLFTIFFCFFNTKFDFWWWLWQPFLYTTSWPQHDVPAGKSCSWYGGSLFVYVDHNSRTPFYDYGNYLYVLLIRPTYLYTYMFTVSAVITVPITAIIIINLIHKPTLSIHHCPPHPPLNWFLYMYTTYGVKPEVRCSV